MKKAIKNPCDDLTAQHYHDSLAMLDYDPADLNRFKKADGDWQSANDARTIAIGCQANRLHEALENGEEPLAVQTIMWLHEMAASIDHARMMRQRGINPRMNYTLRVCPFPRSLDDLKMMQDNYHYQTHGNGLLSYVTALRPGQPRLMRTHTTRTPK